MHPGYWCNIKNLQTRNQKTGMQRVWSEYLGLYKKHVDRKKISRAKVGSDFFLAPACSQNFLGISIKKGEKSPAHVSQKLPHLFI